MPEIRETVQYHVNLLEKLIKYSMSPSKGVLFHGPPGSGKTLLVKAIAILTPSVSEWVPSLCRFYESLLTDLPQGPELLAMWFGESGGNFHDVFDRARAATPCVMFDGLDSIAKACGGGGEAGGTGVRSARS